MVSSCLVPRLTGLFNPPQAPVPVLPKNSELVSVPRERWTQAAVVKGRAWLQALWAVIRASGI